MFLDLTAHRKFSSLASPTEKRILQTVQIEAHTDEREPVYALIDSADHTVGAILGSLGFVPITKINKRFGVLRTSPLTAAAR